MPRRRFPPLLAAVCIALALALPGGLVGVAAQEGGSSFTLNFGTCSWMSSTQDIVFAPTMGSSPSAFDCLPGSWPAEHVGFTLDGELPDSSDSGTGSMTWTNLSDGLHSLDTHFTAPISLHQDVTVDGDTVLWATLYFRNTDTRPDFTPTPVSVVTEPSGPTDGVQIHVFACVVATGESSWIGWEGGRADGFSGCVPADLDAKEWGLRVDGTRPDAISGNTAVWTNLADGTHTATTGRGARFDFSVTDGVALAEFRVYYGPAEDDGTVTTLPGTGAGVRSETGVAILLATLAGSAVAGVAGLSIRRRT